MAKIDMKIITLGIIIISISLILNHTVYAQVGNLTGIIDQKFNKKNFKMGNTIFERISYVNVRYESPTTILISGDLINSVDSTFNTALWEAMDLLKTQYGFKLQQTMTSGVGSVGNPTTVYLLMTK